MLLAYDTKSSEANALTAIIEDVKKDPALIDEHLERLRESNKVPAENQTTIALVCDVSQVLEQDTVQHQQLNELYIEPFVADGYDVHLFLAHGYEQFDATKYDVVINVTDVHHENYFPYTDVYIDATRLISHGCYASGTQYIHIGSLMAELESKSMLADRLYRSQDMALAGNPNATVLRPGLLRNNPFNNVKAIPYNSVSLQETDTDTLLAAIKVCMDDRSRVAGEVYDLGTSRVYDNYREYRQDVDPVRFPLLVPSVAYEIYHTALEWAHLNHPLPRDLVLALRGGIQELQHDGYGTIFKRSGHIVNNPNNLTVSDLGIIAAE